MMRLRSGSSARAVSLAARLLWKEEACCSQFPTAAHLSTCNIQLLSSWTDKLQWGAFLQRTVLCQHKFQPHNSSHSTCWQPQVPACTGGSPSSSMRHLCYSMPSNNSDSSNGDSDSGGTSKGTAATERPRDMAMVFTCAKCDTRAVKAFTRQAYEHGLVLITCPGCKSMHLIADHLGWFGDAGFRIDEYLAAQGQQVKRLNMTQPGADAAQLTAEDLAGWSKVQQLLSTVAGGAGNASGQAGNGCCGGPAHAHNHEHHHTSSPSSSAADQGGTTRSVSADVGGGTAAAGGGDGGGSLQSSVLSGELHGGVVDVGPGDVAAWVRVQQQKVEASS